MEGRKKFFWTGIVGCGKCRTFAAGEMAEWSIAAVLKTVDLNGSGGSNPSLSANKKAMQKSIAFIVHGKPSTACGRKV